MRIARTAVAGTAALLATACRQQHTAVVVALEPAGPPIERVQTITARASSAAGSAEVAIPDPRGGEFTIGFVTFSIEFDSAVDGEATIDVDAIGAQGTRVGKGSWTGTVAPDSVVTAVVRLDVVSEPPPDAGPSDGPGGGKCDPVTSAGCPAGDACRPTCINGKPVTFACVMPGTQTAGEACMYIDDCVAGSVCASSGGGASCVKYCHATPDCASAKTCFPCANDSSWGFCY